MATKERGPTIGYLVWRLSMRWRANVDRVVAPHGLTHATYSVLASLYALTQSNAAPRQRELADVTGLEPAYISKLIGTLERDGFVSRVAHPDDTRAMQLTLTRSGRATIERAVVTVQGLQDEILAPLGGPHSARSRQFKATLQLLLLDTPNLGGMP